MGKKVFWAVPMERAIQEHAVASLLNIERQAAQRNYRRFALPYLRIDVARNKFVTAFMEASSDPDDTLIMLDNDHRHPADILERLSAWPHEVGVVGALAYRRGEPYDPLAFIRTEDGNLHILARWEEGAKLIECTVVATCGIAIKRWVIERLDEIDLKGRYFQYRYPDGEHYPTEDMFFGEMCEKVGVSHYIDVSLEIPHLTVSEITHESWAAWQADHDEPIGELQVAGERDA